MFILKDIILLGILAVLLLLIRRERYRVRRMEKVYVRRLKDAQAQLQEYTSDIDNLITMLVGIHEFGMTATGIISKEELTQLIVDSACRLMRSDNGSLMLLNPMTNELTIVASRGLSPEIVAV